MGTRIFNESNVGEYAWFIYRLAQRTAWLRRRSELSADPNCDHNGKAWSKAFCCVAFVISHTFQLSHFDSIDKLLRAVYVSRYLSNWFPRVVAFPSWIMENTRKTVVGWENVRKYRTAANFTFFEFVFSVKFWKFDLKFYSVVASQLSQHGMRCDSNLTLRCLKFEEFSTVLKLFRVHQGRNSAKLALIAWFPITVELLFGQNNRKIIN